MKKCKKVLALVLALVMLLSAVAVGFTASATNVKKLYTGSALAGKMNRADSYDLTNEQYASIILDFVDKALAEANIAPFVYPVTAGVRISINAKDINSLNSTLAGLPALLDKIPLKSTVVKDIADLKFDFFTANTSRDGTLKRDGDFINALISFIRYADNNENICNLIRNGVGSGSGQFDAGVLNGTINNMAGDIVGDIVGFLKKTLFQDSNANLDTEIAGLITELLNGMNIEMLDGYTFEPSDTLYSTIDKLVRVLTKWGITNIQNDTWKFKDMILSAMPSFEKDYPFIKLDNITKISWDWEADGMGKKFVAGTASTYLIYHINNFLGNVVETIIPEFKTFTGSLGGGISSTAGWKKDSSTSSLTTLNQNIAKAAQYADIKLNDGGTFTDEEAAALSNPTKTYAMVLANAIIRMFFPGIKVEKEDIINGNIATLAVEALNEFMAYYIPENVLTDLYTYSDTGTVLNRTKYTESYCKTVYKSQLAQMIAKFASGYLPEQTGKLVFSNKSNLDAVLKDIAKYVLNVVCKAGSENYGAIGTISSSDTVYTAIDRIILSLTTTGAYNEGASSNGARNVTGIIPEGFLPDSIKTSSHTHCTSKDLVDHLFNCVEDLSVGNLLKVLIPNSSNSEMNTALFPNLVSYELIRIINVIFPKTWTSKTSSLNALITNQNLGNILESIMKNLDLNYHVYPGMKLVANLMGLATAQTRGDAKATLSYKFSDSLYTAIEPMIPSSSTTVPGNFNIQITNTSKGINGGYHTGGNYTSSGEVQYTPYKLKVDSITCLTDPSVKVDGVKATTVIDSDDSMQFPISGTTKGTNRLLEFLVIYRMSNELGTNYGPEQQVRLQVYYGNIAKASGTSNSVTVSIPSVIYGTPSMFNKAVSYYKTSDAAATWTGDASDSTFPKALTDAGFEFKASATGTPESTLNKQFNAFSVSVPSSVNIDSYAGSYDLTYNLKTKNTNDENGSYSANTAINVKWVLFDDSGLEGLVSGYAGQALQSGDFSDTALWNAFENELNTAFAMVNNPGAVATNAAALKSAFAAEAEALESAYDALIASSTADYSELLKQRLVEYADGDAENNIRPKFTRWDYATVGYTRYASSLSTVRDYYNKKETSSIKVQEALRYNEEMAKANILFADAQTAVSESGALSNLNTIYNTYSAKRDNDVYTARSYTPTSIEPLMEALDQAKTVIDGTGLDGTSAPKVSDYADARNEILAALNQLIDQPLDVAQLLALVEQYKEQYNDNMYYTDAAWNTYQKALALADKAINDPYEFVPEDYTPADVAAANAQIANEIIPQLQEAVQTLEDNPYVSSLSGIVKGAVAYDFGKKVVAGSAVIDAGSFIIVPYGTNVNALKTSFEFSKNTSRYNKDEEGNWLTYASTTGTPQFKIYDNKGVDKTGSGTTTIKSGFTVEVPINGNTYTYTVVVSGNVGGSSVSKALFNRLDSRGSAYFVSQVLPNVISNVGIDSLSDADILACDLNSDGMVDNTDLVLLKMWQAGTWVPYNTYGVTA